MRFVPKLIPDEFRVLPDYFKGSIYSNTTKKITVVALHWILAIFLFLSALAFITHPILTLLFGIIGFMILPPGHRWIERKFRFNLTPKIKSVLGGVLFICSIALIGHYQDLDKKESFALQVKKENEEKQRMVEENKEQQRRDSINHYLQTAIALQKSAKLDDALSILALASSFSPNENELAAIAKTKTSILAEKTLSLVKKGDYETALPELTSYLLSDPNNSDLLYNRAICYSKTGKMHEAVTDLKNAIEQGSTKAQQLHEKINPLRKKIIGYETLCCDGSTSNARGRGACSWHGGVCNWNYPVYEEYRKY